MNIAFINGNAIWSLRTTLVWVKMEPPTRYAGYMAYGYSSSDIYHLELAFL
jgi:hypothetical protein